MKIAEFVAEITLKGGKESISTIKGLLNSTIATKAALLGAVAALYKMSDAARQSAIFMDMYKVNTGLSSEQLQRLSFNAEKAGVSINELGGTIQRIQQMQTDFLLGRGNNSAFQWLGLDARKDPISQIDEIGRKLRYLYNTGNSALAKNYASQLGISDTVYYYMITGTTEELAKQFIITQKEQKALVRLNIEWNKLWFYIKQISVKFMAFTAGLQTRFLRTVSYILERASLLIEHIREMANKSKAFKNTLISIGIVVAGVIAYFNPWIAILTAIGLILDDVLGYFQGDDSVTGAIVNWAKNSKEFQQSLLGIKTLFEAILYLGKGIKIAFSPTIEILREIWSLLNPIIEKIGEFSKTPFGQRMLSAAEQSLKSTLSPVGSVVQGVGATREFIVNVTQHNDVRLETGADAQQAGKDFISGMNNQAANEASYQLALP